LVLKSKDVFHESQQHSGIDIMQLRRGFDRLVVCVRYITAAAHDKSFTHDV